MELRAIGTVSSPLTDPEAAPKQGDEGAPEAVLEIAAEFEPALRGIEPGADVFVLTWLDRADRDVLSVHPRDDPSNPETGVFATRSADRPNPIGLHRARVLGVEGRRLRVDALEAVDGTPVLDVKPVLGPVGER
jgi:tRNA-Thr(GGU) m(6)t(6)A37 methyltransferase TsaA